ncbi:MAG: M15 family metallopeptidase [Desulfobacterium sp.]|nr:M15 family metallopeptidase [Desulfobacterium sp.]
MPDYSSKSKQRLATCHPDLQRLFNAVIEAVDCSIIEGHRNRDRQDRFYREGRSKVQWPEGKHNKTPSLAVDAAPYIPGKGISWEVKQCCYFAGMVKIKALELGIAIRWGGDWDNDNDVNDQSFNDLVHFELILPD